MIVKLQKLLRFVSSSSREANEPTCVPHTIMEHKPQNCILSDALLHNVNVVHFCLHIFVGVNSL